MLVSVIPTIRPAMEAQSTGQPGNVVAGNSVTSAAGAGPDAAGIMTAFVSWAPSSVMTDLQQAARDTGVSSGTTL
jgi:hypothetical protein